MTDTYVPIATHPAAPAPPRAARPMLARVADTLYWMSRYIERAEHIARTLAVNAELLTDIGDMAPHFRQRLWHSILLLTDLDAPAPTADGPDLDRSVSLRMTLDPENPNSIVSCVTKARENARSIRENISAEMWEALNSLHWSLQAEDVAARFEDSPAEIFRLAIDGSMLFQGLTEQTMPHAQPWLFAQLGKHLERVDMTGRILETRYEILRTVDASLEAPLRTIHWMAVLRACGSLEAYRRMHLADFDPTQVAAFILFEPAFPRALRFSVQHALAAAQRIAELTNPPAAHAPDRILGRLNADLEFTDASALRGPGLTDFLLSVRRSVAQAHLAIQKTYFLT